MIWRFQTMLQHIVSRKDGRTLVIAIAEVSAWQWHVTAADTGADVTGSVEQAIGRVFDDHSHAALPMQSTFPKAKELAERYAKWWQRSSATPFEACACEEIESPVVELSTVGLREQVAGIQRVSAKSAAVRRTRGRGRS